MGAAAWGRVAAQVAAGKEAGHIYAQADFVVDPESVIQTSNS